MEQKLLRSAKRSNGVVCQAEESARSQVVHAAVRLQRPHASWDVSVPDGSGDSDQTAGVWCRRGRRVRNREQEHAVLRSISRWSSIMQLLSGIFMGGVKL